MDPNDTNLDWSAVARALAGVSEDTSSEGSSPMSYVSNDHDGLTDNELLAHSDSDSDRADQKSGRTGRTSPDDAPTAAPGFGRVTLSLAPATRQSTGGTAPQGS